MKISVVKVPVVMLHSVADHRHPVPWSFLSTPVSVFKKCIRYLRGRGYNTIDLGQLYSYMEHNAELPEKPIVLTFDDGFLDNWVNAYPILRKHGMKGVIFVNPDFVDETTECRPNLEDVWRGRVEESELDYWGYLSWEEMRKMESDGTMDVQSHAFTHTWYFKDSNIIDFHHPGDDYYWLYWNIFPQKKAKWLTDYRDDKVPFGYPIYSHEKSLITRRYFDDHGLRERLIEYVSDHGGRTFFNSSGWKGELYAVVDDYRTCHSLKDHYETEELYVERVKSEIFESKRIIEKNLNKTVDFICWPGGGFNHLSLQLAMNAGYLASTKSNIKNSWGADPNRIHRVASLLSNRPCLDYMGLCLFIIQIESYRGPEICNQIVNFVKRSVRRCGKSF